MISKVWGSGVPKLRELRSGGVLQAAEIRGACDPPPAKNFQAAARILPVLTSGKADYHLACIPRVPGLQRLCVPAAFGSREKKYRCNKVNMN